MVEDAQSPSSPAEEKSSSSSEGNDGGRAASGDAAHVPYAKKRGLKSIPIEEVSKHNTEEDCWIVLGGIVYDVTSFLEKHPGGPQVMVDLGGQDASVEFEDIGHSLSAKAEATEYEIGVVEGQEETAIGTNKPIPKISSSKPEVGGIGWMPYLVVVILAAGAFFLLQLGQPSEGR